MRDLLMGSRATHTVASLGFRCLRGQLQSALAKQLPPVSPGSLAILVPAAASPPVEGRIDGGQEDPYLFNRKWLDPEASSFGSSQKLARNDLVGSGRQLQNMSPSLDRSTNEWSEVISVGSRCIRGIQDLTSETITEGNGAEASLFRDHDFFSRYLQWRSYDRSVSPPEGQNHPEPAADGLLMLTRQDSKRNSPHLLATSSSINFQPDLSAVIPLEASSVKRKRKKKMNKHKQRKLRRRDRHRN